MMTIELSGDTAAVFAHQAMPYRNESEYIDGIAAFVNAALAAKEPVLVEVPQPRGQFLQDTLGADPASILCPYNVSELSPHALIDAERPPPLLRHDGQTATSPRYTDPRTVVEAIYDQQPAAPPHADVFEFSVVADARRVAHDWATLVGLPADRSHGLVDRHQRDRRQQRRTRW